MKNLIFVLAFAASLTGLSQESSAQNRETRMSSPSELCVGQIGRVPRYRPYFEEVKRFCTAATNHMQTECIGILTGERIQTLRSRGIGWAPGYDTLSLCTQIESRSQYSAVMNMITDYGLRLRASEMAIALRATDRQMADCFSSRVGFAQSTRELEECVAPVAPVVTPAPVIRSSPPVQTAPRAATPAPKPTASKPQTPAPRATTPAPTTQAPAAKPTPRPLMDMRLSPELYGESFFQ